MTVIATTVTHMQKFAKAIVAALTALGTWGGTALADETIQGAEWFGLTGVAVAFFAVYAISNEPV